MAPPLRSMPYPYIRKGRGGWRRALDHEERMMLVILVPLENVPRCPRCHTRWSDACPTCRICSNRTAPSPIAPNMYQYSKSSQRGASGGRERMISAGRTITAGHGRMCFCVRWEVIGPTPFSRCVRPPELVPTGQLRLSTIIEA